LLLSPAVFGFLASLLVLLTFLFIRQADSFPPPRSWQI
jgi:hypothetical protein